jgi:hypothetical protein
MIQEANWAASDGVRAASQFLDAFSPLLRPPQLTQCRPFGEPSWGTLLPLVPQFSPARGIRACPVQRPLPGL